MSKIPIKIRERLAKDPEMKRCLVNDVDCHGRVEWDHVFSGMGRQQINEWWSIAPFCIFHHRGPGRTAGIHQIGVMWCLDRAQDEINKYPKHNLQSMNKKPQPKSKFMKCPKCRTETALMICPNCNIFLGETKKK